MRECGFAIVDILSSLLYSTEFLHLPGNDYYWSLFKIKREPGLLTFRLGERDLRNLQGAEGGTGSRFLLGY